MANLNQTVSRLGMVLSNPSWTDHIAGLRSFRKFECDNENDLRKAIQQKMQDSTLRSFLYYFNQTQLQKDDVQQDKLERLRFDINKNLVNTEKLEKYDNICDDVLGVIEQCLKDSPTGRITFKSVLGSMNILRLTGSRITTMDDTLQGLEGLEALVLAGNCLSSCPGKCLPRGLMVLELCFNILDDIYSLAEEPPPHLLYLGLAGNYLTGDALEPLKNFQFLYHLDLGLNSILDMSGLVIVCSQLENLSSLVLIGNPCSMSPNYLTFILENIPKLIFLDGEKLKRQENRTENELGSEQKLQGALQIHLFRVMGLPQPTNQKINKKKVIHSFRLEVDSSVLRPFLPERKDSFITDTSLVQSEEKAQKPDKKDKKAKKQDKKDDASKSQENKKQKRSSDLVKGKKKKLSEGEKSKEEKGDKKEKKNKLTEGKKIKDQKDDFDSKEKQEAQKYELTLKSDQTPSEGSFKSERKNWSKIIEFSEPTIEVSDCNLWALRDILKTNLTVRLVHLKTLPPVSKAKSKPKKQKKSKPSEENTRSEADANKEILVSKSTLAKIKLPLDNILWNKKYLEYAWTITKPFSVEPASGLKDLHYVIKKKKEPKNKKGKLSDKTGELQVPSSLTCHIGVGVKRDEPSGDAEQNFRITV